MIDYTYDRAESLVADYDRVPMDRDQVLTHLRTARALLTDPSHWSATGAVNREGKRVPPLDKAAVRFDGRDAIWRALGPAPAEWDPAIQSYTMRANALLDLFPDQVLRHISVGGQVECLRYLDTAIVRVAAGTGPLYIQSEAQREAAWDTLLFTLRRRPHPWDILPESARPYSNSGSEVPCNE